MLAVHRKKTFYYNVNTVDEYITGQTQAIMLNE